MIRVPNADSNIRFGNTSLLRVHKNILILKYSQHNLAPHVYALTFKNLECENLDTLFSESNMAFDLIEKVDLSSPKDEFSTFYADLVAGIKADFVRLENGAEACLLRPRN